MDPMVQAALIGGGFNVFSGALGAFGGSQESGGLSRGDQRYIADFNMQQAKRNEDWNRAYSLDYMNIRADDARRAGLHPLAALGVNVGSGPTASVMAPAAESAFKRNGFDIASDLSDRMGQGISRAMLAQRTADERALTAATLRKINSETNLNNSMASQRGTNTSTNTGSPPPMAVGNKYQLVKNAQGRYEWILSPEASQGIMSDPAKMYLSSLENAFAGPETYPFWNQVYKSGRRLLSPRQIRDTLKGRY